MPARAQSGAPAAVEAALAHSQLAKLPTAARERLVRESRVVTIASRTYVMREGDPARVGLLVSGLLRCVRVNADGQELTLVWACRPGDLFGVPTVVRPPSPWTFQAVTDLVFVDLPVDALRQLARSDPRVAWALIEHYDRWLRRAVDEILMYAYGDLRQRITIRLLELVCLTPPGRPLVAPVTQEDLAHAVGAARPSVARVLKELRAEGFLRPMYRGILIERPEALALQLTA